MRVKVGLIRLKKKPAMNLKERNCPKSAEEHPSITSIL